MSQRATEELLKPGEYLVCYELLRMSRDPAAQSLGTIVGHVRNHVGTGLGPRLVAKVQRESAALAVRGCRPGPPTRRSTNLGAPASL